MKHIARFFITALFATVGVEAKPLKVFIIVGQSNMEGPANISTFDYIGDDPATAPMLKMMRGADGKPTVCEGAWIFYLTGAEDKNFVLSGRLTAGYGSLWGQDPTKPGDKIGPEFTFGLMMDAAFDEPVLIIKAAWGGKSLHTDFRSPSAGPYQLSSFQLENYPKQEGHGIPKDFEQWKVDKAKETGHYYRLMMEYMKKFEADLISPKEVALWKRGASNAGYHYLGCAKTFALMGKSFAKANFEMMKQ